jgi:hypothetical protein
MATIRNNLSDESIKNLGRLHEEFRLPESRVQRDQMWGIVLLAGGAALVWLFFRLLDASSLTVRIIAPGAYGIGALIGGIRVWRKAGRWYRFGSGRVQSLSNAGTILWDEEVLGIQSGTISYDDKMNAFMTLHWANAKHRIDIYAALAEALKALELPAVSAGVPIDLDAAVAAAGDGRVGPSWRCSSCREENPGNFEQCWKCQKERGG